MKAEKLNLRNRKILMKNPSASQTENWLGAIFFPVLFGIFTFGATFIPFIGAVVVMILVFGAGFFITWCDAPTACRILIGVGSATGFFLPLLFRHASFEACMWNLILFGTVVILGLILGQRTSSRRT